MSLAKNIKNLFKALNAKFQNNYSGNSHAGTTPNQANAKDFADITTWETSDAKTTS